MPDKYKHSFYLFVATIIMTAILSFVMEGSTILIRVINGAFSLALLYIIIGGFLFVTESGFFNITRYGFKKTFRKKEDRALGVKVNKEMIYERKKFPFTVPLLLNGIAFAILTLFISFLL